MEDPKRQKLKYRAAARALKDSEVFFENKILDSAEKP
jgi:hypothetical protein